MSSLENIFVTETDDHKKDLGYGECNKTSLFIWIPLVEAHVGY